MPTFSNPYAIPDWAAPASRAAQPCECGRAAVAVYTAAVATNGAVMGERTSANKLYKTGSTPETLHVCHACLIAERYLRGELSYKEADRIEAMLRAECTPRPPAAARLTGHGTLAAEQKVARLAAGKTPPRLTARRVAGKKGKVHAAALALLLAEAEGRLTLTRDGKEVVYHR